jgi:hypothetical protein
VNRRVVVLVVLGIVLSCLFPTISGSYELKYTENGSVVRWFESCVLYSLHEAGDPTLDFQSTREAIRDSFDTWEEVPCSYFYFEETEPASCDEIGVNLERGNMNLLVWVQEDWTQIDGDHDTDVIALTSIAWRESDGQLLDSDIEFNSDHFSFGLNGESNLTDLRNTATHEIGHLLGLQHSTVESATMNATAFKGDTNKRTLDKDDIAGVCALYPNDSDPNICMLPICGLDLDCSTTSCAKGENRIAQTTTTACTAGPAPGQHHGTIWEIVFEGFLF